MLELKNITKKYDEKIIFENLNVHLFDRKVVNVCKYIWENRNDDEKLEEILKMLKEEKNNGNTSAINSEKVVVEKQHYLISYLV